MDENRHPDEPEWLDEFRDLANRELQDGSSCEQVHPIVESWYHRMLQQPPPPSRDSVLQAMACLATEVLHSAPEDMVDEILANVDEDTLASWIEYVLMVGRAFESALRKGELDDL
ncbi:MAG: hypothetical protein UZ15_CFX003001384 [Chloroflexi bacterium OLB15]|nr:MAG: hypothetical protein UZ15_CFX003001384 [Chloroflexi bacterium OLB15]